MQEGGHAFSPSLSHPLLLLLLLLL